MRHACMLGLGARQIRQHASQGCASATDSVAHELLANGMAIPHVAAILLACATALPDVFRKK